VEGFEAPYGKAQFVLIGDTERIESFPSDHEALLSLAKANPGQITYPAPPDFTGSAFVRNIIYEIVGYETFVDLPADKETVREAVEPAMAYLQELAPYLWRAGETYPATISQVENMYADGELILTMSYNPNLVAERIGAGQFSATSEAFLFEGGTIGNTHFLAIPENAPNKEAAKVLIDLVLSPEIQADKYVPANWGDLPVVDAERLSGEQRALFDEIPLGQGVPAFDTLQSHRLPEMPSHLVPLIEEIWMETVAGSGA
jgi:putative spermidine/putrescine transport system substrate-binding protein